MAEASRLSFFGMGHFLRYYNVGFIETDVVIVFCGNCLGYDEQLWHLKTVSVKNLKKSIGQLKSKTSAGSDGLTQKQLKSGVSSLASPLQNIIMPQ